MGASGFELRRVSLSLSLSLSLSWLFVFFLSIFYFPLGGNIAVIVVNNMAYVQHSSIFDSFLAEFFEYFDF
jgi:hypothetical protein